MFVAYVCMCLSPQELVSFMKEHIMSYSSQKLCNLVKALTGRDAHKTVFNVKISVEKHPNAYFSKILISNNFGNKSFCRNLNYSFLIRS